MTLINDTLKKGVPEFVQTVEVKTGQVNKRTRNRNLDTLLRGDLSLKKWKLETTRFTALHPVG